MSTTNRLLIRASDATSWVMCIRRVWFDKHQPITEAKPDAFMQFLFEAGLAHEASILKRLSEQYLVCRANSAEHTLELMEQGAQVIYQGRLVDSEMHLS